MSKRSAGKRAKNIIILFTVGFILLSVMLAPYSSKDSEGCVRCHSGFEPFRIEFMVPGEIPAGEEFDVSVVIMNPADNDNSDDDDDDGFPHEIRNPVAELDLSGAENLELVEGNLTISGPDMVSGKSITLSWTLASLGPGEAKLSCEVQATVHYDHSSDNPDDEDYMVGPVQRNIMVKELPIRLSTYSLSLNTGEERSFEIVLHTDERITNLTFTPDENIAPYLNHTIQDSHENFAGNSLDVGEWLLLNYTLYAEEAVSGTHFISWTNSSGQSQNLSIDITIHKLLESAKDELNWFLLSGQVSGINLFVLFLLSVIFGGFPKKLKKLQFDHGLKGKKRVELHCQISYFIIALSIFHMSVLIAGPWGESLLDRGMILGYFALILMSALGVNGALQKKWIIKYNAKHWRLWHRILTIAVVTVMVMHAVRIGTHFEFFRSLK